MTSPAQMIGWAHTAFGRSSAPDVETLMSEVAGAAVADAGLDVPRHRLHHCRRLQCRLLPADVRRRPGRRRHT